MIDVGATVERLDQTMPECVQIIVERFSHCPPTVLAIKDEMVHQKKDFIDTPIWVLILYRMNKAQAALVSALKHIDNLETPEQLLKEVYSLALKCMQFEKKALDCWMNGNITKGKINMA